MSYMTAGEAERLNQPKQVSTTNVRIALAVGALMLLAGAVGPWVTALGVVSLGPTADLELTILTFGGAGIVALSALLGGAMRLNSILVGTLVLIETGYGLVRLSEAKSQAGEFGALISPGWGLYLTILAGIFLIISTFIVKPKQIG